MRNKIEYEEQCKVAKHVRLKHPDVLMTISPAGLITSIGLAMKTKNMGYKSGTPDMLFLEPRRGYHGLLIEMKTKTGELSKNQIDFIHRAIFNKYQVHVSHSAVEAIKLIDNYLEGI